MTSCSSAVDDGRVVELQVGEDGGDFEGVGEIGIARGALLVAVRLHGIDVGAIEQRLVRLGIVAAELARRARIAASWPAALLRPAGKRQAEDRPPPKGQAAAGSGFMQVAACRVSASGRADRDHGHARAGRRWGRRWPTARSASCSRGRAAAAPRSSRRRRCRSTGRRGRARASGDRAAAAALRRLPARRPRRSSGSSGSAPRADPPAEWCCSAISRSAMTGFLSSFTGNGDRAAVGDRAGAVRGQQNQLEAVRDLVDAIFDCHACHERHPSGLNEADLIGKSGVRARKQAGATWGARALLFLVDMKGSAQSKRGSTALLTSRQTTTSSASHERQQV